MIHIRFERSGQLLNVGVISILKIMLHVRSLKLWVEIGWEWVLDWATSHLVRVSMHMIEDL
jgi:hypothetical protein